MENNSATKNSFEGGGHVNPQPFYRWIVDLGPYVFITCIGIALYYTASRISYAAVPGQMGPERWPKIIIGLMIAVCAFEIARRIFTAMRGRASSAQAEDMDEGFSQQMEAHPLLVAGASAATVAYLLLFDICGFFVSTTLYLAVVMWLAGIRRPVFVPLLSVVLSFAFAFFFMKLIYVALPLGQGPFAQISLLIMTLVGVR